VTFLFSHFLFAFKYWEISFDIKAILSYDEHRKKKSLQELTMKVFYALCFVLPTAISFIRFFEFRDKLQHGYAYSKRLNITYMVTLQLCFLLAFVTIVFLLNGIRRI
jgi:uncharacterized membrane protein YidH (DUF202 family)